MNNNNQEYYEGLGIPRDADQRAIQDPYRRLAMKWHPYRNKSAEAGERFKRMATAYAIRSDPRKRPWCDARGFESVAHDTYDDLFGDLDLGSRCTLKARRNSNTQAKVLCSWPPSPREQMEVAVDARFRIVSMPSTMPFRMFGENSLLRVQRIQCVGTRNEYKSIIAFRQPGRNVVGPSLAPRRENHSDSAVWQVFAQDFRGR